MLTCPEILLNPTEETKANRGGIVYVISRMDWYWNLSNLLLKENIVDGGSSTGLRCELEKRIVDLYKALLSYQMKSVCAYYRNQGLVFLRDVIKLDNWDGNLKSVQDAENAVRQDSDVYNTQQIRSNLEQLVDIAKNQETKLLQDIHRALHGQVSMQMEKEDKQCLKDLRVTDPSDDMTRIEGSKDRLLKDSYVWILKHQDFIDWRDGDETRLLWIKGDPGKGKTMLLIGVIKELLQKLKSTYDSSVLSYFFCQATDSTLNSATSVLRGLIYQLLVQQQSLISHVREKYDKAGRQLFEDVNAFFALSNIFTEMLRDPSLTRVYLIVDALDECESGLSQLLDLFVRNASASSSRVKWLVSSRHRVDIEEHLRPEKGRMKLNLELNAHDHVSRAVNAYIDHKVSELSQLKQYDSKLRDDVRSYIHSNADGTFLWVALVCKELARTLRRKTLSVLKSFPSGLQPFYQRMMEQMHALNDGEDLEICKRILASITLAYRPIHLEELVSIAGIPEELLDDQGSLEELVGLCGSFLIIREGIIYFVHQSAKDYLNTHVDPEIFPHGRAEEHCRIVSQLLQIMSNTLQRDIYKLRDPGYSIEQVNSAGPSYSIEQVKSVDQDPLARIRYACVYWIDHLCEIDSNLYDRVGLCDSGIIDIFLKKHFLHWLEALSLMRSMSNGVVMIRKLENLLSVSISFPTMILF